MYCMLIFLLITIKNRVFCQTVDQCLYTLTRDIKQAKDTVFSMIHNTNKQNKTIKDCIVHLPSSQCDRLNEIMYMFI